jgi:hypothetical protein
MRGGVRDAEIGGVTAVQWLVDELQRHDFLAGIDTALDNSNRVASNKLQRPIQSCQQLQLQYYGGLDRSGTLGMT